MKIRTALVAAPVLAGIALAAPAHAGLPTLPQLTDQVTYDDGGSTCALTTGGGGSHTTTAAFKKHTYVDAEADLAKLADGAGDAVTLTGKSRTTLSGKTVKGELRSFTLKASASTDNRTYTSTGAHNPCSSAQMNAESTLRGEFMVTHKGWLTVKVKVTGKGHLTQEVETYGPQTWEEYGATARTKTYKVHLTHPGSYYELYADFTSWSTAGHTSKLCAKVTATFSQKK